MERPADHAHDAERVAAAVVGERLRRGDVPAVVGGPGGGRVDGDEAEGVGEGAPGLVVEGVLGGAVTPVREDEEGRAGDEGVRDVEVEGDVGGVGAEGGYLLEGCCCCKGQGGGPG